MEENIFFSSIERVGSMGKYQIYTQVVWCAMSYMAGGLLFITPFLFFQDPYQCQGLPEATSCLALVCSLPPAQREQYVPTPTIFSLADKFADYRCNAGLS